MSLLKDPRFHWSGIFPYDALEPAGVYSDSSLRDVLDASFELMTQGQMTPEVRQAWDDLRHPDRRLLLDFLLYDLDLEEELARIWRALDELPESEEGN